ncbi:hypothetical protein B0H14DRAFT_2360803, partial [Mycena olivaceomarginata]
PSDSTWFKCKSIVSRSLDECVLGSWVFAQSSIDEKNTVSGRIADILLDTEHRSLVILELFQVPRDRDSIFGMPVLVRRDSETSYMLIPGENVLFDFNVQHDCSTAECEGSGVRLRRQERVESDQIENHIVHSALDRYFINSHALHNAHLIRATLPRDLLAPIPYFEDRKAKHEEFAAELRKQADKKTTDSGPDGGTTGKRGVAELATREREKDSSGKGRRLMLGKHGNLVARQWRRRALNPPWLQADHGGRSGSR